MTIISLCLSSNNAMPSMGCGRCVRCVGGRDLCGCGDGVVHRATVRDGPQHSSPSSSTLTRTIHFTKMKCIISFRLSADLEVHNSKWTS